MHNRHAAQAETREPGQFEADAIWEKATAGLRGALARKGETGLGYTAAPKRGA